MAGVPSLPIASDKHDAKQVAATVGSVHGRVRAAERHAAQVKQLEEEPTYRPLETSSSRRPAPTAATSGD